MLKEIALFSFIAVMMLFSSCSENNSSSNDKDAASDIETDADADADAVADDDTDEVVVESIEFEIPDERTDIVSSSSKHYAFPDVVKLQTGKFMLVYRMGAGHAEDSGRIIIHHSEDGIHWGDPDEIINDNTIDDRDPSITVLSDGRVAVNWFQYRYPVDYSEPWVHHIMFAAADKNGTEFGNYTQVDTGVFDYSGSSELNEEGIWVDSEGAEIKVYASSSSIVEDGTRLIIPGYGGNSLNFNNMSKTPKGPVVFFISNDSGLSWEMYPVEAEIPENTWIQEPALLKVNENRWILQVRTAYGASPGAKGDLMQSVSDDGGKTWSAYKSLGFVAHAPELLKLDNGVIVSSFRWLDWTSSVNREAVSMVYSLDQGETWSEVVEIEDCGLAECGYPGMVELEGNRLLVVYYLPGGAGISLKVLNFQETVKG